MTRNRVLIFLVLTVICVGTVYKYRRFIVQKLRHNQNSSGMNQRNAYHLKEGACIAKNNRLNLPQKKLSQLSSVPGLKHVSSSASYHLDDMTASKPLLTNQAIQILSTIANDFQKRLEAKGYKKKKIVITSMTRSVESQQRLSKTNINAASKSAHLYGSTFDIAYHKFQSVSNSVGKEPSEAILVQTLEETLVYFKKKESLVGIKEYKQPCFHITATCTQ